MAWLECVPNVSEGRRKDVLDRLVAGLHAVDGVRLLDVHSDPVHHRSVFTLVGEAAALTEAVLGLCDTALSAIDLRHHDGAHPRIGALDVVPFVPLGPSNMAEAVRAAQATAAALATRFELPVFLYEEAATAPHRRPLEEVRRGRFEGLAAKLQQPAWHPDFGPSRPHPSGGATAIGARRLLVAYNINLATADLAIGRAVATAVRARSGGLPHVKAMALALPARRQVQVSMNLTNVAETPMHVVYAAVRAAAAHHGVDIVDSEIVGLVPASALTAVAVDALRVTTWRSSQVLDGHLEPPPPSAPN